MGGSPEASGPGALVVLARVFELLALEPLSLKLLSLKPVRSVPQQGASCSAQKRSGKKMPQISGTTALTRLRDCALALSMLVLKRLSGYLGVFPLGFWPWSLGSGGSL